MTEVGNVCDDTTADSKDDIGQEETTRPNDQNEDRKAQAKGNTTEGYLGSDSNTKSLHWYDGGYPALRAAEKEKASVKKREKTMIETRILRKNNSSKGRSRSEGRSTSRGSGYLPYFRSKSTSELDAESLLSHFHPVVNHKEIINHTYTCHEDKERSKSRSSSRQGFTLKRVKTIPANRDDHQGKTAASDNYRNSKDIYSESNTDGVQKHFFSRLADVKKEEYRAISRSTNKDDRKRKKTLLRQIEDLKKINSKYGRATEKMFRSKFSTYYPTDISSRSRRFNAVPNNLKNSHDFSKWRHKRATIRPEEPTESAKGLNKEERPVNKITESEKNVNKEKRPVNKRSYKGPSWEKEGLSYMRRLERQEHKEDSTSGDSDTMRQMLKEAESMLNIVEHNFPEAVKQIQTNHDRHPVSTKTQTTAARSQSSRIITQNSIAPLDTLISKAQDSAIAKAGREKLSSGARKDKVKPSAGHDKPQHGDSILRYKSPDSNTKAVSKSSELINPNSRRAGSSTITKPPFNLTRSKSLNPIFNSTKRNRLSTQISFTSEMSTLRNNKLPKLPTAASMDQMVVQSKLRKIKRYNTTISGNYANNKLGDIKYRHSTDLRNQPIVIPAPPLLKSIETDKTAQINFHDERKMPDEPSSKNEESLFVSENVVKTEILMEETNGGMTSHVENSVFFERPSPTEPKSRNGEKRPVMSGYLIRIEKVQDVLNDNTIERIDKNRKTPSDMLKLSRQSFHKTPTPKPGSRERFSKSRNGFSERLLITPVSVKNQGQALLIANCRLKTPVISDKMETFREQSRNEESDFFLTSLNVAETQNDHGSQTTQGPGQTMENSKKVFKSHGQASPCLNILKKEISEDVLSLGKWKALVQDYLTENENPAVTK